MALNRKAGAAVVLACALAVASWNYFGVQRPVAKRLGKDQRNEAVSVWVHHRYGVLPQTIVLDLRQVNESAAPLDVVRVLFHAAEALKDSKFDKVVLAHRGTAKFVLKGEYFQELGRDLESSNPLYLIRTLPQNVYKLDGTKAYGTWTGGIFGVLGKQMEDMNRFSQDWYLTDLVQKP